MECEAMKAIFDYTGRNVFVAGGTSGINLGIAKAFAAAGARVGVGSRSQEKVDAAVAELSAAAPALGYAFDVRDHAAVATALAAFAEAAGSTDVLVSGAAGNFPALARDLSANGFKAVVDIDLLGTFHVMKAAYPSLRRPGGSVINVSAPQAQVAMSHQAHVCAAKAGVDMPHPLPCHRVGSRGPARQRRRSRPDRGHRGHGPAGAHPRGAGPDGGERAARAHGHSRRRRRRLSLPRL
jgi:enoyl-[acyl-carrier-protein] reductase (NADH)